MIWLQDILERFQVMKFLRKLWKWLQLPTPLVPYPNATTGHVSATSCNTNIPLPSPQHNGVPVHHGKISFLLFDPLCSYCMHVGCMSKLHMTHTPILKAFCNYCINLHVTANIPSIATCKCLPHPVHIYLAASRIDSSTVRSLFTSRKLIRTGPIKACCSHSSAAKTLA